MTNEEQDLADFLYAKWDRWNEWNGAGQQTPSVIDLIKVLKEYFHEYEVRASGDKTPPFDPDPTPVS